MAKRTTKRAILQGQEERWVQFRRAYPKVAKALDLFQVSQEQYERALNAMYGPRLFTANSTSTPGPHPGEPDADME